MKDGSSVWLRVSVADPVGSKVHDFFSSCHPTHYLKLDIIALGSTQYSINSASCQEKVRWLLKESNNRQ